MTETTTSNQTIESPPTTEASPGRIAEANMVLGDVTVAGQVVTVDEKSETPDPSVEGKTVSDRQWETLSRRLAQQDKMIEAMIKIFTGLNGGVMFFVFIAWATSYQGRTEIITENVVMSLIGATVIQAGLAFITITKFLFPSNGDKSSGETQE